jgi:hypothetical protein
MNGIVKYALIAAVIGGVYFYSENSTESARDIDLNAVLDVTVDTLHSYQASLDGKEGLDADAAFSGLAAQLAANYNTAQPPLHSAEISVQPREDASLLAYEDGNKNDTVDEGENALFLIEVDGEQSRIIATSGTGAVNEHHFSGTSLLAGYLIGSMLGRQRAAGVNPSKLAAKQPVTAKAAARARAGSGSHARGK